MARILDYGADSFYQYFVHPVPASSQEEHGDIANGVDQFGIPFFQQLFHKPQSVRNQCKALNVVPTDAHKPISSDNIQCT